MANRFATSIPTRELHYWASEKPASKRGMIMIYTDRPNLTFWANYVGKTGRQDRPEWQEGPQYPHNIEDEEYQDLKPEWPSHSIRWQYPEPEGATEHEQHKRILEQQKQYRKRHRLVLKIFAYLNQIHPDLKKEDIEFCGIRDWGRAPYFAACHAWRPERQSWTTLRNLSSFEIFSDKPMSNRYNKDERANSDDIYDQNGHVHICGEAYSNYHGFIEGSLRSAQHVLHMLTPTREFPSSTPWLCLCDHCMKTEDKEYKLRKESILGSSNFM